MKEINQIVLTKNISVKDSVFSKGTLFKRLLKENSVGIEFTGMFTEKSTDFFDCKNFNELIKFIEKINLSNNQVDHPEHYGGKDNPYEVIKIINATGMDFCLGNAIKYILRAGKKDQSKEIEDLEKAEWYLKEKISQLKNK